MKKSHYRLLADQVLGFSLFMLSVIVWRATPMSYPLDVQDDVPPQLWREWMSMFTSGSDLLPATSDAGDDKKQPADDDDVGARLLREVQGDVSMALSESAASSSMLDSCMFEDYLNGRGMWSVPSAVTTADAAATEQEEKDDAKDDADDSNAKQQQQQQQQPHVADERVVHDRVLGAIVQRVCDVAAGKFDDFQQQVRVSNVVAEKTVLLKVRVR